MGPDPASPPPFELEYGSFFEAGIILHTDPEPIIEATANGHTVVYRATTAEPPGCD